MTTPKLLFVDDEPNLLQALRRMLRPYGGAWTMEFVETPGEALAKIRAAPFDVVVSDIRMPVMNGAKLLEEVAQCSPSTVRFVLSGQADYDMTLRTIGPSHQFMAKPCDARLLATRVKAILEHRAALPSATAAALAALPCLPSPRPTVEAFRGLLRQAAPDLEELASLIDGDLALSTRTLQLATSAYFGRGSGVIVSSQAVRLLGLETLRDLVRLPGFVEELNDKAAWAGDYERLLAQARKAGESAGNIALSRGLQPQRVTLLRQIGKFSALGSAALLACGLADDAMAPRASAYLAALWGLPQAIVGPLADLAAQVGDDETQAVLKAGTPASAGAASA